MMRVFGFLVFALILLRSIAYAQDTGIVEIPPLYRLDSGALSTDVNTAVLRDRVDAVKASAITLSLRENKIEALRTLSGLNNSDAGPIYSGISRTLDSPQLFRLGAEDLVQLRELEQGTLTRRGALITIVNDTVRTLVAYNVTDAEILRLRLANVEVPEGTEFWLYGDDSNIQAEVVDRRNIEFDMSLWTPHVQGPNIFMEISVPIGALDNDERVSFEITHVLQNYSIDLDGQAEPVKRNDINISGRIELFRDATCFNGDRHMPVSPDPLRRAVLMLGRIRTINGEQFAEGFCSAGLLNNTRNDGTPYVLTANHCFVGGDLRNATRADALGVTGFWDYHTANCTRGLPPQFTNAQILNLPRSTGAIVRASRWQNDFAFLEFFRRPDDDRAYLAVARPDFRTEPHQRRYYFSHPSMRAQTFATGYWEFGTEVPGGPRPPCPQRLPSSEFEYTGLLDGHTAGGSSGSVVVDGQLGVAGQHYGTCSGCMRRNSYCKKWLITGRMSQTFPRIRAWLVP